MYLQHLCMNTSIPAKRVVWRRTCKLGERDTFATSMTTLIPNSGASADALLRDMPAESIIFGKTNAMAAVRDQLKRVADTNLPILIEGESGTGKDMIARLVHLYSPWRNDPFVKVNCPAIPGSLLESELFGYEKGAFTGASTTKPGRMEMAGNGSLFLDEISELDLTLQSKLLQVLQDGQICRIGGFEDRQIDARIICATNRRLEEEVELGSFRGDLYYRVAVINLRVPPLRERLIDLPELVDYLFERYSEKFHSRAARPGGSFIDRLSKYNWPGNIRELENIIKRYVILGGDISALQESFDMSTPDVLELDGSGLANLDHDISLKTLTREAVQRFERRIILRVLQNEKWNRKRAAKALKISYRALLYKLKDAGVPPLRGSHS